MPYCVEGGHRCAQTPLTAYYVAPGTERMTGTRWRLRLCIRHGRALLERLYRRGLDLEVEGSDPELCVGCGLPGDQLVVEVAVYEGDWQARFAAVACKGCDSTEPHILIDALVGAEKLPPREKGTKRASRA